MSTLATRRLAAVNSINWARILAQIVYDVHAYLKVTEAPAAGAPPPKASFSVPTGNFGDILAGFYAKSMGLPVERLVVDDRAVGHLDAVTPPLPDQ